MSRSNFAWAEGHYDRLPELAADLVRREVAVIFAVGGTAPAQAAKGPAGSDPIAREMDRWYCVAGGQREHLRLSAKQTRVVWHEKCVAPAPPVGV